MVKQIVKKTQQDTKTIKYEGNNLLARRKLGEIVQEFRERLILWQTEVKKWESQEPRIVGY